MTGKVVVRAYGISLDGFSAGTNQGLENPLGERGTELMSWFFPTKVFRQMQGEEAGEMGIDNQMAERGMAGLGAWILGRNMFAPIRGPWPDENWKGWWGDDPPYHVPTFVLTHHKRSPIKMKGGTEFIFVTDGIESALEQARAAAGDRDIRIGGGAATVRQYLEAKLIDELHLAVSTAVLGAGERPFEGIDLLTAGYEINDIVPGERATHMVLRRA